MSRKLTLSELDEPARVRAHSPSRIESLGGVEQVRDLESAVPGAPGQLCGLDRRADSASRRVVRLQEDAQGQLTARLLRSGNRLSSARATCPRARTTASR